MAYVKELQIEKIFLFAVLLHMSFLFAFFLSYSLIILSFSIFQGAAHLMSAPAKLEIFLSGEKENAGIAALCRGFLTMDDGKRAALSRDAHR